MSDASWLWAIRTMPDDMRAAMSLRAREHAEAVRRIRELESGHDRTTDIGPEIDHALEGQRVSVIFDGEFVGTNPETHGLIVRGNSRGSQHIDWTMEFHWSSLLFEPSPSDAD